MNFRPRRHCLTDPVDVFNRDEYLKFVSTYPGQDYSPNEQCQDILGLDSYYGWVSWILQNRNVSIRAYLFVCLCVCTYVKGQGYSMSLN